MQRLTPVEGAYDEGFRYARAYAHQGVAPVYVLAYLRELAIDSQASDGILAASTRGAIDGLAAP